MHFSQIVPKIAKKHHLTFLLGQMGWESIDSIFYAMVMVVGVFSQTKLTDFYNLGLSKYSSKAL